MSPSKKVLIILTGSIACYKVCHVISRLVQAGVEVQIVATPAALKFIGAATLEGLSGNPVISDMYASGNVMEHIHLMRWADLILVAPGTANFINKAAQGVSDDLVQTLFLAHDFKRPFLVAPAMNTSMYLHPATQKSLKTLISMGVEILETASGVLACGEQGWGKLLDSELLLKAVQERLQIEFPNAGNSANSIPPSRNLKKILITAGGTQEPLDSVRTLTNLSSGRTGIQIAEFFESLGFEVTLVKSLNSRKADVSHVENFSNFQSLQTKLEKCLSSDTFDFLIHAAAVSDYSIETIEVQGQTFKPLEVPKINSDSQKMSLHLKRNPKIIDSVKSYSLNKNLKVIGFKLTSGANPVERLQAVQKLFASSNSTYIVHNDLTEIDSIHKQHKFTVYDPELKAQPCESLTELCGYLGQKLIEDSL